MKVLLDENIPYGLRGLLAGHNVSTVAKMGWSGIENGTLLTIAADSGFDVLITTDRGMEYQQNRANLSCSVIVLLAQTNKLDDLRPLVPHILDAILNSPSKSFIKLEL